MRTPHDLALYIWDYFYVSRYPAPGDEKTWRTIENATARMQTSVQHAFWSQSTVEERVRNARFLRRDARIALRQIALLSTPPDAWVLRDLGELERAADAVLNPARETVS